MPIDTTLLAGVDPDDPTIDGVVEAVRNNLKEG
jgi:hypothetical protein